MLVSPAPSSNSAGSGHHGVSLNRLASYSPQHYVTDAASKQRRHHVTAGLGSWTANRHDPGPYGPAYMNGHDRGRGVTGNNCYRVNEPVYGNDVVKKAQSGYPPPLKNITPYRPHPAGVYSVSYTHSQTVPITNSCPVSYPNIPSAPFYNSLFIPPSIYPPGVYPRPPVYPGVDPFGPAVQSMGSQPLSRSTFLSSANSVVPGSLGYCTPERQSSDNHPSVDVSSVPSNHSAFKTEKAACLKNQPPYKSPSSVPHSPDHAKVSRKSVGGEPSPKRAHFSDTVSVSYGKLVCTDNEAGKCRTRVTYAHAGASVASNSKKTEETGRAVPGDMPIMPSVADRVQRHFPAHFMRGSIIQLATGDLKRVEELTTEDFVNSANVSPEVKINRSVLIKIEESPTSDTAFLSFRVGQERVHVTVEAALEHPFFVFDQGWSSCRPDRTLGRYSLRCSRLQEGAVCISLTQRETSSEEEDPSVSRKPRCWSAPEPCPSDDEEGESSSKNGEK